MGDNTDRLLADLARWEADRRIDEAVEGRVREHSLQRQAHEEARFVGLLVDLAEKHETVVIQTATANPYQGQIAAVGREFLLLRSGGGNTFLRRDAIVSVRTSPDRPAQPATGSRSAPLEMSFLSLLAHIGEERPTVRLGFRGEVAPLTGQMLAVGEDVISLRIDATDGGTTYVPAQAVIELAVLDTA